MSKIYNVIVTQLTAPQIDSFLITFSKVITEKRGVTRTWCIVRLKINQLIIPLDTL